MTKCVDLSVLLLREGDYWVAQCLEFDIAAQGKTLREVKSAFARTVFGQILVDFQHGEMPFENAEQAPQRYRDEFQNGEFVGREAIRLPDEVPLAYQIRTISSEFRMS